MSYWGLTPEVEAKYTELCQLLEKVNVPEKRKNLFKFPNPDWLIKTLKKRPSTPDVDRCLELLLDNKNTCPGFLHTKKLSVLDDVEATIVDKYKKLGLEVIADSDYRSNFLNAFVSKVCIDLPAEVWVDMLNLEGEILPACCGNISRVRDILFDTARNNYEMTADHLFEAYQLLKDHDCGENGDEGDPLTKIRSLWETVKDDVALKSLHTISQDPNELEDAISVISRSCDIIQYASFFTNRPDHNSFKENTTKIHAFNRLIPAIKTLYERTKELNLPVLEGYAVCSGNKVMASKMGFLIEQSFETAQNWADELNQMGRNDRTQDRIEKARDKVNQNKEKRNSRLDERYSVKKVQISVEHGIMYEDGEEAVMGRLGDKE